MHKSKFFEATDNEWLKENKDHERITSGTLITQRTRRQSGVKTCVVMFKSIAASKPVTETATNSSKRVNPLLLILKVIVFYNQ